MKKKLAVKPRIRVAVVDGDPLRFVGLRSVLASESDLELVSASLAEMTTDRDLDVILVWHQTHQDAFDAISFLRAQVPFTPIVLTGRCMSDEAMVQALAFGAKGCVDEVADPAEFAKAIRVVCEGSIWVSRRVLAGFVERTQSDGQTGIRAARPVLTPREKEVLQMLVAGHSNKEIGVPLGIEERTVKAHVARLMRKVGARNRIMLSVHAVAHSLVASK